MILAVADGSSITDTVISGPFLLAGGLALAAGVVSFASPCVLPLVPGYLAYLVGLVGAEGAEGSANAGNSAAGRAKGPATAVVRSRAVVGTLLFVAGFTLVFLAESLLVLGLAAALQEHVELLTRVGGAIVIVMGLAMLGYVRPLQREARIHARPTGRVWGAVLLGAFFAIGWTVCMGPTFAGVNALAISSDWNGNAWRGLSLVILYCVGLGLPFVALALGFGWATTAVGVLRRHSRTIQVTGGVLLIVLGLLMVTGLWGDLVAWLRTRYADVGTVL
jgi:cytochrome c-type biogenesis protein